MGTERDRATDQARQGVDQSTYRAATLERIPPQLEAAEAPVSSGSGDAPQDRIGGQQAATEGREGGPEEVRRRSWWQEFFGFGE